MTGQTDGLRDLAVLLCEALITREEFDAQQVWLLKGGILSIVERPERIGSGWFTGEIGQDEKGRVYRFFMERMGDFGALPIDSIIPEAAQLSSRLSRLLDHPFIRKE